MLLRPKRLDPRWLRSYETSLGLEWKIEYVSIGSEECHISSDPEVRCHEIEVPSELGLIRPGGSKFPDVVHELCHAHLAERIDPAFATIWFHRKYDDCGGSPEFQRRARMLQMAWCHVDIWVDDLMHKRFPRVAMQNRESALGPIMKTARINPEILLQIEDVAFGVALILAEEKRVRVTLSGLDQILARINAPFPLRELVSLYAALPRLKMRRDPDLSILAMSVQSAAQIMNYPIRPRLVAEDDGRMVWEV